MTPDAIASELRRLSRLNFTRWNESDVREDFIAKLLALLGYRKDSDYDINREGAHLLSRAFIYIGRQRVDLDYALLVRKRRFWIIEAKGPTPKTIAEEAVFQAHFYALHPEVAARFFVVTNGWETRVYDLRSLGDDYLPALHFSSRELPSKFAELNRLLGASYIRGVLRDRIVHDLREVLQAEFRDETVDDLAQRIQQTIQEARPVVRANRIAVIRAKHEERPRAAADVYADATPEQIVRVAFETPNSNNEFELVRGVFDDALRGLDAKAQAHLFAYVCKMLDERPASRLRRNWVRLLLHYRARFEEDVRSETSLSMGETAERSIRLVLTDFAEAPPLRNLARLEAGFYRLVYKLTFTADARELFRKTAARAATFLQEEDLVFASPTSADERVRTVERMVGTLYRRAAREDAAALEKLSVNLEAMEPSLEEEFQKNYAERGDDERDLSFLSVYGTSFDVAKSALCDVLCSYFAAVRDLIDPDAVHALEDIVRGGSTTVNYAEELLLLVYSDRGLISVAEHVANAFNEVRAAHPLHFVSARDGARGIRVHGRRPDGARLEFSGHLTLEPPQIHVTQLR